MNHQRKKIVTLANFPEIPDIRRIRQAGTPHARAARKDLKGVYA
jgi:hypothetical protein